MSKGKLIILSAPSGTGKTSICKELIKRNPKWKFSISATTRESRPEEKEGKDYIFVSNEKFDHLVKFGDLLEWEWVHGNRYGTLLEPLEKALDKKQTLILDIDVKGSINVMEEFEDDVISIFVEPPGLDPAEQLETLQQRLENRGDESSTLIKQRIKRFELEREYKENFSHHFINDDFTKTTDKIEKTIKKELK